MGCDGLAVPSVLLRRRDGAVVFKLGDAVNSGDGGRELAEPKIVGRLPVQEIDRAGSYAITFGLMTRHETQYDTKSLHEWHSRRIYETYGGCPQTCFG